MTKSLYVLARKLGEDCLARNIKIALAESCTGGSVSSLITAVPGSSAWFNGAVVVYSNLAKETGLDVAHDLLEQHGAVSEPVAKAMAIGALKKMNADLVVSITGIAGPSGGTKIKPVGIVCFGLADNKGFSETRTMHFTGGRAYIRESAARFVLEWMELVISSQGSGISKKISR